MDFGPLVAQFTQPLDSLQLPDHSDERMKVEFERVHEYEAHLDIVLIAGQFAVAAFAGGFIGAFGQRLAEWLWDWLKTRTQRVVATENSPSTITGQSQIVKVLDDAGLSDPQKNEMTAIFYVQP